MKLQISRKMKYVAKDKIGSWWGYLVMPSKSKDEWNGTSPRPLNNTLDFSWFSGDWEDSLHRVLNDGTIEKVTDLPDLAADTPVLVCDFKGSGREWLKRHFSHFASDGSICCFSDGGTHWTETKTTQWSHWKLPEEEALRTPKKDDLVLVRDSNAQGWIPRYFSHFGHDGGVVCFDGMLCSSETTHTCPWRHWKNPKAN